MKLALTSLLFYLIGSIPFSFLIGKLLKRVDIRKKGSKNTGATNVARLCGFKYGVLALFLDLAKGALAAALALVWGIPMLLIGLAVLGHNWSPFLKLSGGKGVATSLGLLAVISWKGFLVSLSIWVLITYLTSYISVGSMSALMVSPLVIYLFGANGEAVILMLLLGLIAVFQHRENIDRLIKGKENKLNFRKSASQSG